MQHLDRTGTIQTLNPKHRYSAGPPTSDRQHAHHMSPAACASRRCLETGTEKRTHAHLPISNSSASIAPTRPPALPRIQVSRQRTPLRHRGRGGRRRRHPAAVAPAPAACTSAADASLHGVQSVTVLEGGGSELRGGRTRGVVWATSVYRRRCLLHPRLPLSCSAHCARWLVLAAGHRRQRRRRDEDRGDTSASAVHLVVGVRACFMGAGAADGLLRLRANEHVALHAIGWRFCACPRRACGAVATAQHTARRRSRCHTLPPPSVAALGDFGAHRAPRGGLPTRRARARRRRRPPAPARLRVAVAVRRPASAAVDPRAAASALAAAGRRSRARRERQPRLRELAVPGPLPRHHGLRCGQRRCHAGIQAMRQRACGPAAGGVLAQSPRPSRACAMARARSASPAATASRTHSRRIPRHHAPRGPASRAPAIIALCARLPCAWFSILSNPSHGFPAKSCART